MIRALIVDDEGPARARLRHLLAAHEVDVVGEAAGGAEALDGVAALTPDVLFLDIHMPGMSGLELAARLKPPRPRIVFCTAFDQFAIQAFEQHAVDYLLKPVNRQRLAGTLERVGRDVMDQRQRAREEQDAARTQARLMPAAPAIGTSLDCAASCQPARTIGGDHYDILPLGGGRVGLTLADVSGKGTYAALLGAALQARIQATAVRGVTSPAALLRAVNELTVGTMEGHRFATVFFGVYDSDARTLRCASAGHPPALLVRADGSTMKLRAGGPAIGWPETVSFEEDRVDLREGDTIVTYSDGVTEASSPDGEEFGLERLARIAADHRRESAAAIIDSVHTELARFTGGSAPQDDATLLIARVNA